MMKLSKRKRFLLLLTMFISLFTVNCSLFVVSASANAVPGVQNDALHVSLGVPISFQTYYYDTPQNEMFEMLITEPNVYYYDEVDGMPSWTAGVDGTPPSAFYDVTFRNTGTPVADVLYHFSSPTYLYSIGINYPILVSSLDDMLNQYDVQTAIYRPYDDQYGGNYVSSVAVQFSYAVLVADLLPDGTLNYRIESVWKSINVPVSSDDWLRVNLSDGLPSDFFSHYKCFVDQNGVSYAWILDVHVNLMTSCWSNDIYLEPRRSSAFDTYQSFVDVQNDRLASVYDAQLAQVNFDDISWTDWLVDAVGGFMDFQIVPGLTLSGIFALLIGMSLFMIFLKVFAGG